MSLILDYNNNYFNFNMFKSEMTSRLKPYRCYFIDLIIPTENSLSRSLILSKSFYFKFSKTDADLKLKTLYDAICEQLDNEKLHSLNFHEDISGGFSVDKGFIISIQTS